MAEVRPLGAAQVRPAGHALARAFDDDDWFRWLLPDPPRRYRALRRFFGAAVSDALGHGRVDIVDDDGLTVAVASWLPPGAYPPSPRRQMRQLGSVLAAAPLFPRRIAITMRTLAQLEKVHLKEEHWYLAALGTDPTRWRRGLGSAVLEPGLALAEADGRPCYLETQAERNLAFYGKHGFDVVRELRVDGCPLPLWTMLRPAR